MNVRLGTSRTIMVGPVLDADGVAKTNLAVAAILASKNGGNPAALDGSATLTHKQTGHYLLLLTANDISALGCLELSIDSTTDAMPIVHLNVLTAAAWDALQAASGGYLPSYLNGLIGTALTETSAGYIAAAVKKLFDVASPLLVASDVMRGTDSANTVVPATKAEMDTAHALLATAAKLLAYFQLAMRKDYAISQDNSAEATEINADGGTGAGTFDNTTDAEEGLRDRGDQGWITGGSGGATKTYVTTDWTRTVGDDDGGAPADTATVNAAYYATGEVNSTTLLEVDAVFTLDDVTETARELDFWGFYAGGGSHAIHVQAYNTVDSVYEPVGVIGLGSEVELARFALAPNHTNSATGTVTIKFIHASGTGIASHVLNIDKCSVNSSVPSTTAAKLLSYIQLIARSDAAIKTDRTTELAEINGNEGSGAGDFDNLVDSEEALSAASVAILAMLDDPRGEPGQGAPAVNPDLATKIDYLFKNWRNKKTQTSSEFTLFADDTTTADQQAAITDDTTTATKGEMGTGA